MAALTLPTLIQKNHNKVVETRLEKFYSTINQAVKMAEVDYGDKKFWFEDVAGAELDKDGNPIEGSSDSEKWFNKYLAPYMKIIKIETLSNGTFIIYFPDGSALRPQAHTTRDWSFYPSNPKKCIDTYGINSGYGICQFAFNFVPTDNVNVDWKYHYNKGFEPWKWCWRGTEQQLKDGCYHGGVEGSTTKGIFCTALIQYNRWKIPDDYPYKVSY